MKRFWKGISVAALLSVAMAVAAGSAAGAGTMKLVEGTVYDTTCPGTTCLGCPPPCGGPTPAAPKSDYVCAQAFQRRIVCPLAGSASDGARPKVAAPALVAPDLAAPDICLQGRPCGSSYPIYSGEGAFVTVRRHGTTANLATLPIVEGHFALRLGPGEYVFRPYLPEPQCWSGEPSIAAVTAKFRTPVPATLEVANACVVHPDVK